MNVWIKKRWYINNYPAIIKKKTPPFATTWIEPESPILSGLNQTDKDKYHISLICGIQKSQTQETRMVVTKDWGEREVGRCCSTSANF